MTFSEESLRVIPAAKTDFLKLCRVFSRVMQKPRDAGIRGNSGKSSAKLEEEAKVPGVVGEVGCCVLWHTEIDRHFSSLEMREPA